MAEKPDDKDQVTFKELMMYNSIMVDTLAQLMIEKGICTEEEFYSKLKQVQSQYEAKKLTKQ